MPPPHRPSNYRRTLGGEMWRLVRREWACSFRLRQQLFRHKQFRNGLVFMNISPNSKTKAVSRGGFADGMSKPIPYSFVQPDTIQRKHPKIDTFRRMACHPPYGVDGPFPVQRTAVIIGGSERIKPFPTNTMEHTPRKPAQQTRISPLFCVGAAGTFCNVPEN